MKILLALLMLLTFTSCTAEEALTYDQEHIDVTLEPEALYTAMTERDVIWVRETRRIFSSAYSPIMYQTETKGYLLPNFSKEVLLTGNEAVTEYRSGQESLNRIEVYSTPECTGEPEKVIDLTGLENKVLFHWLYADEETGHFTCIGNEGDKTNGFFYEFSETGELLQKIDFPEMDLWHFHLVNQGCLYGDVFYFVKPLPGTFEFEPIYDLYYRDFSDGTKEQIEENIAAADFEGNSVYYLKRMSDNFLDGDGMLCRMDLTTLETEILAEMDVIRKHVSPVDALVMDEENNMAYYSTSFDAYSFDPETQETVHIIHSGGAMVRLIEVRDSVLYSETGSAGYILYDLPETPVPYTDGLTPLKFMAYFANTASDAQYYSKTGNNPYTYTSVFDLMKTNGYGSYSEMSAITNKEEYAHAMAKKLMAGDSDFDIFYVSTEMAQLFDSQYYEDLTRYSRLSRDYFDEMVPGLKDICTIDGRLSLVPLSLNAQIMVIDNSLAEGSVTFPRTVDDLLTLADTVTLTDGSYFMGGTRAATVLRKLFEEFAANYILSDLDDETALADLTNLYEMCTLLGENDKMILSRGYTAQKRLITFGMNNGMDVTFRGDIQSGSLPKINENYKTPVSGEFWAINPNSENKELAGAFLLCLLGQNRINTFMGTGVYYMNDELPESTPEVMAIRELFRQQLTEGIRSYEAPDVFAYVDMHFKQIKNNEITAAEAAAELMRYLRMVKFE
ncbi:MAG: extracellular solute-binding protein [Clostridia bacterium]|nr:extracellular solute-binding protein [Clostridia bacterium]